MTKYRCEHCGNICPSDKNYCPECGTPIRSAKEEQAIEGVSNSELHSFIDKNSSRYVEVFSKNKDKKVFISFNWAAGLFGFAWMFYRKMYRYAFIFLAINILLVTIFACGFAIANREEIKEYVRVANESKYTVFRGEDAITVDEDGNLTVGLIPQVITDFEAKMKDFVSKSSTAFLALNLALALFADCIYRSHIKRNISLSFGGVSIALFFVGAILDGFIENVGQFLLAFVVAAIIR